MPPTPLARAVADRFMFDTGNLKYLAATATPQDLDRITQPSGWTVRQVLAHLAASQTRHAGLIAAILADEEIPGSAFQPDAENDAVAADNRATPIADLIDSFDTAIRALVAATLRIDERAEQKRAGDLEVGHLLLVWSGHAAGHAMEMVEELPFHRDDPMILNWLLYEDFTDEPLHLASQQKLLKEIRDKYGDGDED